MGTGMRLRDLFVSKAAAAVLAAGLVYGGGALADDNAGSVNASVGAGSAISESINTDSAGQGQSLNQWNVDISNPHLPYEVIYGVGGLALLLAMYGAARRNRGSVCGAAAAFALSAAMLNPSITNDEYEVLPTEVVVAVDRSASQTINDRNVQTDQALAQVLSKLSQQDNVNVHVVDVGSNENGTDLFGAVAEATAAIPAARLGSVIDLTDGQVHGKPRVPPGGAPMHAFISGEDNETDRRIVLENAPAFGVVDEEISFRYRVLDEGKAQGASSPVRVRALIDGEEIAAQTVTAGEAAELKFKVFHGGKNIVELEAAPLDGELTQVNNRTVVTVEGVRDKLRVFLVSGEPNAGERTWRNLLKSDPSIELVHFTILSPPNKQDGTPVDELALTGFPATEIFMEKLHGFDLVIFDRWQYRAILPPPFMQAVVKYVEEDGGAVLLANGVGDSTYTGLHRTPLGKILSTKPTGELMQEFYKPQLSETGEKHPVVRGLEGSESDPPSWGRWYNHVGSENEGGDVIMEGIDGQPLVILGRQGEGRVAEIRSPDVWLWARGFEGGGPHQELLKRISHWLMKEPALEEEALKLEAEDGKLVIERQTLEDKTDPVTLISPSGEKQTVKLEQTKPGIWQAVIEAEEQGLYKVEQGERLGFASVGTANPKEFADTRSTTEILRPVVEQSGGLVTRMTTPDAPGQVVVPDIRMLDADHSGALAGEDWIGIKKSRAVNLQESTRTSLTYAFAGLCALLVVAGWARAANVGLSSVGNLFGTRKGRAPRNEGPSI